MKEIQSPNNLKGGGAFISREEALTLTAKQYTKLNSLVWKVLSCGRTFRERVWIQIYHRGPKLLRVPNSKANKCMKWIRTYLCQ